MMHQGGAQQVKLKHLQATVLGLFMCTMLLSALQVLYISSSCMLSYNLV